MIWFFASSALAKLAVLPLGARLLHGPLDNPNTWVMGRSRSEPIPIHATPWTGTTNLRQIPRLLRGPDRGVVLDLERWRFTPPEQQRHPVQSYAQAARFAHEAGKWIMATPALDLFRQSPLAERYLQSRIAERIAPYVDAYDIQAQGLERYPVRYAQFVRKVAGQLRRANPHVVILAGLSTNPSGTPVTLKALEADYRATRSVVDGYWLNIPAPGTYCPRCQPARPELAARFLAQVVHYP